MPFRDRADAGRRLAEALAGWAGRSPVVLALPRGGVPVAAEVASALRAPLDLVLVRKIGLPSHPELAMGAVVDGPEPLVVRNEEVIASEHVSPAIFDAACAREVAEIARRRQSYIGARARPDLHGRAAIVVDDGIATGATARAALRAVRRLEPAALVLAVPVAAADTVAGLSNEADAVVCLETPEPFAAVGLWYDDFQQVSDAEVRAALARFPVP